MNSPYYFDYNSTSPLANSVKDFLAKGVFFEANPSAAHSKGKKALKLIHQTKETIQELFQTDHQVVFTSGASEGLNWFVFDHALRHQEEGFTFVCFASDHSVALAQEEFVKEMGGEFLSLPVDQQGSPDLVRLEQTLKEKPKVLLNWTWVNNETGVVWDLDEVVKLKQKYRFLVHVDAPQALFKTHHYQKLKPELDMYSYSGHKFGALKGVGFSLIRKDLKLKPMIRGGDQQKSRSGTLSTTAIYSMHLALKEKEECFDLEEQLKAITYLRKELQKYGHLFEGKDQNLNTISLALKETPNQLSLIKFDLAGVAISTGSACQSGSLKPSHVILAMGYPELADKTLRFSFEMDLTMSKAKEYLEVISEVLKK